AQQQVKIEGEVHQALQQATLLQGQARSEGHLSQWVEALAAVQRAEGLLVGNSNAALVAQVAALRAELEASRQAAQLKLDQAAQDRIMIARLEATHAEQAAITMNLDYDPIGSIEGYQAAFRAYGIDVASLSETAAARLIEARAIRIELA